MDIEKAVSAGKEVMMKYAIPLLIGTVIVVLVTSFLKKD